jgi:hypothetical protein
MSLFQHTISRNGCKIFDQQKAQEKNIQQTIQQTNKEIDALCTVWL